MKQLFFTLILIILLDLFLHSCANPITPTGGPKDTIPPTLISSTPVDQSLRFQDLSIEMTFDEFINADKLKQNLVITPITEIKYKTLVKKESISIRFEQPFEDSTTYTLNFFDGITDITEKNPVENLVLAFSTGDYIDSLAIFGAVSNLFTGAIPKKITIGLYKPSDTLDFKSIKPTYFTTSTDEGSFQIQNIKANPYRLMAFEDKNKNLLFDPASEQYAFLKDTLYLKETILDSLRLPMVNINAATLKLISARPSGRYFEIRYTKPINQYSLLTIDSTYLPSTIVGDKETVRIYPTPTVADSLQTIITAIDSLKNMRKDTLYVKFRESSRKADEYKVSLSPKPNTSVFPDQRYTIEFNKPSKLLSDNFISIPVDTIMNLDFRPKGVQFNHNSTKLSFSLDITAAHYRDSLNSYLSNHPLDSTAMDSAQASLNQRITNLSKDSYTLSINPQCFISCENDTSQVLSQTYKFAKSENFGIIRVLMTASAPSYFVQLINKETPVKSLKSCTTCVFTEIPPGNYWVRILIDSNNDGEWSPGNILTNTEPESVIYFKEETTLRANWDIELNYSF
ncbi:MAG: Ig-like domain-containing domain [Marinoscillum sp.]|uniref:Ig-like domain-containing domain n=1 Tax=Marinoscillum sp. TaxID=2024838 RepID=UPI0032F4F913